ncbi:hypothetical protein AAHE18_10G072400 [Arachis hypogaea]
MSRYIVNFLSLSLSRNKKRGQNPFTKYTFEITQSESILIVPIFLKLLIKHGVLLRTGHNDPLKSINLQMKYNYTKTANFTYRKYFFSLIKEEIIKTPQYQLQ